ncbi:mitogen-activated protein kinase [Acrasis kona]|uniref:Mitogen-activated protein kinase n=1 Tax=Acrasis kona TaxID=1008807 RepID=A0AAW2YJ92_9EUKA
MAYVNTLDCVVTSTQNVPHVKLLEKVTIIDGESFALPPRYAPVRILGQGSFGVVCSAKDSETNEMVAIKKLKNLFIQSPKEDKQAQRVQQLRALRELNILKFCNHPNVIGLRDIILPEDTSFEDIYIVMECMAGDLRVVLNNKRKNIDNYHCRHFVHKVIQGLSYLHSANVLHRDVKPSNILLDATCNVKICDMGMAREVDPTGTRLSTNYVQSRYYRAPELLLDYPKITTASDMWAVGCVFAEILLRRPLFVGTSPVNQIEQIVALLGTPDKSDIFGVKEGVEYITKMIPYTKGRGLKAILPRSSDVTIDLLSKLLHFNPNKRITAMEALQHPYFKDIYEPSNSNMSPVPFHLDERPIYNTNAIKNKILEVIRKHHKIIPETEPEKKTLDVPNVDFSGRRRSLSEVVKINFRDFFDEDTQPANESEIIKPTLKRSRSKCKLCKELRPESTYEGLVLEVFE